MKSTKRITTLLIYAGIFAFLCLSISSCTDNLDIDQVDDPSQTDGRNEDKCKLFLVGQVLDAETMDPIPNATVHLQNEVKMSDGKGRYQIQIPGPLNTSALERLIAVRKSGYLMDTYQFTPSDWLEDQSCSGTVSYVCVDFVLTPKNDAFIIQPDMDNMFTVRDTTLALLEKTGEGSTIDTAITTLDVLIPAGAVDSPTEICITTYARPSYLADLPDWANLYLPVLRFRISTDPMIMLRQPFTIRFESDHPVQTQAGDDLMLYRFDDLDVPFNELDLSSNEWRVPQDAVVSFDGGTNEVVVQSPKLGSYMVANQAYFINFKEFFELGDVISSDIEGNCDCGDETFFWYKVNFDGHFTYDLEGSGNMSFGEQLIYLNDLKILTNTPFSSLLALQNGPNNNQFNHFVQNQTKSLYDAGLIRKCEVLFITATSIDQLADGNQYFQKYDIKRSIGTQVSFNSTVCPTTTPCHQGCP